MYEISKQFSFSASHSLAGLPDEHPCSRLHGHNYEVVIVLLGGRLNSVGFVRDYRELDGVKKWIDESLDHRHLNDIVFPNATAEYLARHIFRYVKQLGFPEIYEVRVSETPKTWATYRG